MTMLRIVIEQAHGAVTVQVEGLPDDTIRYRPCAYCGKLVRHPRKTCCNSHRTLVSVINRQCKSKVLVIEPEAEHK